MYNRALRDIWRSDRGNEKTKNNPYICICKCCLEPFLAEIKHLIKENLTSYVF